MIKVREVLPVGIMKLADGRLKIKAV